MGGELPEDRHVHREGVRSGRVTPERVDAEPLAGLYDTLEAAMCGLGIRSSCRGQDESRGPPHRRHVRGVDRDGLVTDVLGRCAVLKIGDRMSEAATHILSPIFRTA